MNLARASLPRRLLRWTLVTLIVCILLGMLAVGVAYWLISPRLPDVSEIRDIRLQVPLKVLADDGKLLAIFGETRRTPVKIAQIPEQVKKAFIAVEDARFYEHPGIDVVGIARALWLLASTDRARVPGGSTITQQVTRSFFLSSEYTFTRKLTEIFLSLRLERELSKDEILELYLNKIFFGYRAYGVVAAADFYYGKSLAQLTLAESAMLASIPKFPSSGNPLHNPARALQRRNYVLDRMRELRFVPEEAYRAAVAEPDHAHPHEPPVEVEAPYVAEMVRQAVIEQLGADALSSGYVAHTTIDPRLQAAANAAVREGLMGYDRRHGFRGAEGHVELAAGAGPTQWQAAVAGYRSVAGLLPGLVTEVASDGALVYLQDGQIVSLDLAAVSWARRYRSESSQGPAPSKVDEVLERGDVIRVLRGADGTWQLSQVPKAQGALTAMDPDTGAIRALVGGFSFSLSKFNRATQSNRNPGSSFKPFIYSSAFERGYTPASIVNDAPIVLVDPSRPDGFWRPSNDDDEFLGPMRLREAMVRSRNLVSVRVLQAIGVRFARDHIHRFGFPLESLPGNLSLALGTASLPPLALSRGYAVFANGGFLVEPHFLTRVESDSGEVLYAPQPGRACRECDTSLVPDPASSGTAEDLSALLGDAPAIPPPPVTTATTTVTAGATDPETAIAPRVIDPRNAFMVTSLMRDVVLRGTGRGALELERNDLAGKTGTTNEHRDAWFSGFNDHLVATTWVGFDDFTSLGRGEFASKAALPIWVAFMRVALAGVPETPAEAPPGITTVRIDPGSGRLLGTTGEGGVPEYFRSEDLARVMQAQNAQADETREQQGYEIF